MRTRISVTLNGEKKELHIAEDRMLVDMIREDLGLKGAKTGCREGECGACTVLMDGMPVNSCLVPAVSADGKSIVTIEGLENEPLAQKLMTALADHGASQCGFCTPGMVMMGYYLLKNGRNPSSEAVRKSVEGNLCRCTGYQKIIDAIMDCNE